MKRTMVQNDPDSDHYINFISSLVEVGDLGTLNMILNDPEIAHVRMQYIRNGQNGYKLLMESSKNELLNQFMKKVLRSEEERKYLESLIDHDDVCDLLICTQPYDSANEFLNWKFETVEERNQCKDYFKDHDFSLNWILKALMSCGGNVEEAKKKTSRFLEWVWVSEDDVSCFKKEITTVISEARLSDISVQKVKEMLKD